MDKNKDKIKITYLPTWENIKRLLAHIHNRFDHCKNLLILGTFWWLNPTSKSVLGCGNFLAMLAKSLTEKGEVSIMYVWEVTGYSCKKQKKNTV